MNIERIRKWLGILFLVLLLNTAYIWAFASPTIPYMGNVLIHLLLGAALYLGLVWVLLKDSTLRQGTMLTSVGLLSVSFATGLAIVYLGNTLDHRAVLYAHIVISLLGVAAMAPWVWSRAQAGGGWLQFRKGFGFACALLVILPATMAMYNKVFPEKGDRIVNPLNPPLSMREEGGGPHTPFFPSSAQTNVGGIIPSNFFMDSEACGRCHKDIYDQWNTSTHHFGSFNNQFYRKAIEYMQDVAGTQPSKWCAGCHDHAVFFNGRFEKPIKDQIDTPEAHAGLACTSCHAIVKVDSSMGNGGFTIQYPPLHELASSKNKYMQAFDKFLTFLDPEPHKATFIKPFMRQDASEYCSGCHKVHLDQPVNNFRWFRGFNDYDNWQASGVSGQGARSFYYPATTSTCVDCHMPKVKSNDPGNKDGWVRSHRFPAANTALPHVNGHAEQLKITQEFLKSGFITVDIFAASPAGDMKNQTQMVRRAGEAPQAMSGIAAGEESEQSGAMIIREVGEVAAPLDKAQPKIKPGDNVRIDVVVRTRKIGHFFPGGTVDAFDIWLELEAKDADGKHIFWSGQVDEKGFVEPGAHFYRALQLDAEGNPINKRNAWQARTALYARMIPPGAADTVHYLLNIPKDVKGPISLSAKLNHRKFSQYYVQFAYAGKAKPGQDPSLLSVNHNSMEYDFDKKNIPANVSGKIKGEIPNIPITVLATAEAKLDIGDANTKTEWKQVVAKDVRERWNDWGIGLLLQGDLKAAEYAFKKVTVAEPGYADGWLNVARALIQEGQTDEAKPFIAKAMEINSKLGRVHYFKALIEKADGEYDAALKSLDTVIAMYPRDRVVLNQKARIQFLKREYKAALETIKQVCLVDPEDVQMHYTAMLCYRGLGMKDEALREQKLFQRFKVEESVMSITGKRRMVSPEDNNERQQIHDHVSVDLKAKPKPAAVPTKVAAKPKPVETSPAGGAF